MQSIPDWLEEILSKPTCSVQQAGRALGYGKNTVYEAVATGKLKVLDMGKKSHWRVPTAWLRRTLELDGEAQ